MPRVSRNAVATWWDRLSLNIDGRRNPILTANPAVVLRILACLVAVLAGQPAWGLSGLILDGTWMVTGLDTKDGSVIWRQEGLLEDGNKDHVLVSDESSVSLLEQASGKRQWRWEGVGEHRVESALLVDEYALVAFVSKARGEDERAAVVALAIEDGREVARRTSLRGLQLVRDGAGRPLVGAYSSATHAWTFMEPGSLESLVVVPSAAEHELSAQNDRFLLDRARDLLVYGVPGNMVDGDRSWRSWLCGYRISTGERLWQTALGEPLSAPLLMVDGRIVAGTYDEKVYILDFASGAVLNTVLLPNYPVRLERVGRNVLVELVSRPLLPLISVDTGHMVWQVETLSQPNLETLLISSGLGWEMQTGLALSPDGSQALLQGEDMLALVDANHGYALWRTRVPHHFWETSRSLGPGTVAWTSQLVIIHAPTQYVALDRKTGSVVWTHILVVSGGKRSLVASQGVVVASDFKPDSPLVVPSWFIAMMDGLLESSWVSPHILAMYSWIPLLLMAFCHRRMTRHVAVPMVVGAITEWNHGNVLLTIVVAAVAWEAMLRFNVLKFLSPRAWEKVQPGFRKLHQRWEGRLGRLMICISLLLLCSISATPLVWFAILILPDMFTDRPLHVASVKHDPQLHPDWVFVRAYGKGEDVLAAINLARNTTHIILDEPGSSDDSYRYSQATSGHVLGYGRSVDPRARDAEARLYMFDLATLTPRTLDHVLPKWPQHGWRWGTLTVIPGRTGFAVGARRPGGIHELFVLPETASNPGPGYVLPMLGESSFMVSRNGRSVLTVARAEPTQPDQIPGEAGYVLHHLDLESGEVTLVKPPGVVVAIAPDLDRFAWLDNHRILVQFMAGGSEPQIVVDDADRIARLPDANKARNRPGVRVLPELPHYMNFAADKSWRQGRPVAI